MIYNKPRDLSWKLLPSLGTSALKKAEPEKSSKNPDNLIKAKAPSKAVPSAHNVDIILDGKPDFVKELELDDNTIIDLNAMPIIDGIPILKFPDEPYKEEPKKPKTPSAPPYVEPPEKEKKSKEVTTKKQSKTAKSSHKLNIFKAATFFVTLYTIAVIAFILPLRPTYSETEKRELSAFPTFSLEALTSGDYFDDISTWFSDTFPFREQLTKIGSKLESFYGFGSVAIHGELDSGDEIPDAPATDDIEESTEPVTEEQTTQPPTTVPVTMPSDDELSEGGNTALPKPDLKTQNLGAIIVAGNSGYEYYSFSKKLAPRFIDSVSAIGTKTQPETNVYTMLIPTSIDITLNDALRAEVDSANQEKALTYFNGSIKNSVVIDTLYNTLRGHRNEYIYFRTDHHWTALGAYYAYVDFCNAKGINPVPIQDYETVTYNNFTGTFYTSAGQSSTLEENADQVLTFTPFNNHTCTITRENGSEYKWDIVTDVSEYGSTLKYLTFIGGDNPLTTIVNNDNPDGEICVVIKDSYGNAFVPFLVPHYSKIYVIDPRHYKGSLEGFAQETHIDDVIFISNISTTRNEIFIEAMENLVK